ncbi:MAG: hypothetical protein HY886_00980 [Deltaproteobacteria bacterium]|nr:hypothetical protein [Deltaproteobacteria bacterium]
MPTDKKRLFKEALKHNRAIFASKEKMRLIWAKKPVEEKIAELIKLQEATAVLHPELRSLIPWRLKKR